MQRANYPAGSDRLLTVALQSKSTTFQISEPFMLDLDMDTHQARLEFLEEKLKLRRRTQHSHAYIFGPNDQGSFKILAQILSGYANIVGLTIRDKVCCDDFFSECKLKNLEFMFLDTMSVLGENLATFLTNANALTFLEIKSVNFTEKSFGKFGEFLASCNKLQIFFCDNVNLFPFINLNQSIKRLHVTCSFRDAAQLVQKSSSAVENFDIVSTDISNKDMEFFCSYFSVNTTIKEISISYQGKTLFADTFGGGFKGNSTLKSLSVFGTPMCLSELHGSGIENLQITFPDVQCDYFPILEFLEKTNIKSVAFSDESFEDVGNFPAKEFVDSLLKNNSISQFSFLISTSNDDFTDQICRLFKENPEKLHSFYCTNTVSPNFLDSLCGNSTLTSLTVKIAKQDLGRHQYSLEKFVRESTALKSLTLTGGFNFDVHSFYASLIENCTLKQFYLGSENQPLYDAFTEKNNDGKLKFCKC